MLVSRLIIDKCKDHTSDSELNVLTIAGSDPSAGAGIQADIKTFSELGCYGLTAITAITAQSTSKFVSAKAVLPNILARQLDSILLDFEINAVKVGMVLESSIIKTIHKKIKELDVPIVLDPVIQSTTGGTLLKKCAVDSLVKLLIPIATVITPNVYELGVLAKTKIKTESDIYKGVKRLVRKGAKDVIVTGFEKNNKVIDHVFLKNSHFTLESKKISGYNHGSGCSYSAALAASLAKGYTISDSIHIARKFALDSIRHAKKTGKGISIVNYKKPKKDIILLKKAIQDFAAQKNSWQHIPECQTNFVFAKKNPKSIKDILGLDGRIVRAGKKTIVAGDITLGGSKHVATAVLQINKKFPNIRAGINIRYSKDRVARIKRAKMSITSYDRKKEPVTSKNKEGSSIQWGISQAIKKSPKPYDAIYHTGDLGKEPMIILFGQSPTDVLEKLARIT